jgi:hypothetical protein
MAVVVDSNERRSMTISFLNQWRVRRRFVSPTILRIEPRKCCEPANARLAFLVTGWRAG